MVIFDQLRISDDGTTMYVDIHIPEHSYYDDLYLDTITIQTSDAVSTANPEAPTIDFIYKDTFGEEQKQASLVINKASFDLAWLNTDSQGEPIDPTQPYAKKPFKGSNLSKDLFFVYIGTKGTISPEAPCGEDDMTTVGVTFDETMFHQLVMYYTRELAQDCNIPMGFIDLILLWQAFNSAVETEHFIPAIEFYNRIFGKERKGMINTKGCGCHG